MNGQVSLRNPAAARADNGPAVRAAVGSGGAGIAAVPLAGSATTATSGQKSGRHRSAAGKPGALRRALSRAASALAPYQRESVSTAVPSGSGSGIAGNTGICRAPSTASIEVAALYGHTVYVPRSPTGGVAADTSIYVSASGATRQVAAEHNVIAYRRAAQYWHRAGNSKSLAAPHVVYPAVAEPAVRAIHGGGGAGTADAYQPGSSELLWRAEWLKSRQAQVQEQASSDQIIVRQDPSVPSTVGR